MYKLSSEGKDILSKAMNVALHFVDERAKINQDKMLNLMSRVEFDKYRIRELMQLSKDIMKTQDDASLIKLLNAHSDILIELADASVEADRWLKSNRVRVKRR